MFAIEAKQYLHHHTQPDRVDQINARQVKLDPESWLLAECFLHDSTQSLRRIEIYLSLTDHPKPSLAPLEAVKRGGKRSHVTGQRAPNSSGYQVKQVRCAFRVVRASRLDLRKPLFRWVGPLMLPSPRGGGVFSCLYPTFETLNQSRERRTSSPRIDQGSPLVGPVRHALNAVDLRAGHSYVGSKRAHNRWGTA
jgi:hypothetical protein